MPETVVLVSMHPDDIDPGEDLTLDNEAAILYRRAADLADRLAAAGMSDAADTAHHAAVLLAGVMAASFEHPGWTPDDAALS